MEEDNSILPLQIPSVVCHTDIVTSQVRIVTCTYTVENNKKNHETLSYCVLGGEIYWMEMNNVCSSFPEVFFSVCSAPSNRRARPHIQMWSGDRVRRSAFRLQAASEVGHDSQFQLFFPESSKSHKNGGKEREREGEGESQGRHCMWSLALARAVRGDGKPLPMEILLR